MNDTPSPLTDSEPIDPGDLATWVERTTFDDHTPASVRAETRPQIEGHPLQGWRPADENAADWAMARLADVTAELEKVRREHEVWMEKVVTSRRNATRSLEYRQRFFTEALAAYGIDWRDEAPDLRGTLHLPSGTIATTVPVKPKLQLLPAAAGELVAWLRTLDPEKVAEAKALKEVDPEPKVSGVAKLVDVRKVVGEWVVIDPDTGEVVPGVVAHPPGPTSATPKPDLSSW